MSSFRKLLPYVKPYWKQALIAPLLMMMEVAMDLAQPQFVRRIVDIGIAQMQMSVIIRTGLLMIAVALLGAFGGVGQIEPGPPGPTVLRRDGRKRYDRRHRCTGDGQAISAKPHRRCSAGIHTLQRNGPRQHPLRQASGFGAGSPPGR